MIIGLCACGRGFDPGVPLTGRWGGKDLVADLTATGGSLDLTCGFGELDGPLVPDGGGHVNQLGYHIRVGGPPPRPNEVPARTRISVNGVVDGDRLTLTVTGVSDVEGPPRYSLIRGHDGVVLRCP
ncbi:MAG: hypothetical protein ABI877_15380 [Gemmatimonadaceae bacterium]